MREIKLVEITDEMKENQEKRKSLEKKAEDLCKKNNLSKEEQLFFTLGYLSAHDIPYYFIRISKQLEESLKDKDIDLLLSTEHLISESSCPEFPDNS